MELYILRNPQSTFTIIITFEQVDFREKQWHKNRDIYIYRTEVSNGKDLLCWVCREIGHTTYDWQDRIYKKLAVYNTKLANEFKNASNDCDICND